MSWLYYGLCQQNYNTPLLTKVLGEFMILGTYEFRVSPKTTWCLYFSTGSTGAQNVGSLWQKLDANQLLLLGRLHLPGDINNFFFLDVNSSGRVKFGYNELSWHVSFHTIYTNVLINYVNCL